MELELSPYDNQISLLYKAGDYFETPIQYITIRDYEPGDITTPDEALVIDDLIYEPLMTILARALDSPNPPSLAEAFAGLTKEGSNISKNDFAFIYRSIAESRNLSEEEIFRLVQVFMGQQGFRDIRDFRTRYDYWVQQWSDTLQQDKDTLDRILDIQDNLTNIPPEYILTASDLTVERVTLRMYPTFDTGEKPSSDEDGISIFNAIQPSYFVPYIQYNSGNSATIRQTYYKVYRGEASTNNEDLPGAEPNLDIVIPTSQTRATNRGRLLYMTVWAGDPIQVITHPTREGYTKAIYDLETGILTCKTRISPKNPHAREVLIERIAEALSNLILGEAAEIRISAEFDIFLREEIQDYILLHEILNNPTFTAYLYVEERQKAYPEKKRITIHYRSILGEAMEKTGDDNQDIPAASSAVLGTRFITSDQVTPESPLGTPYLHVNVTKATSREVAEQFRNILTLLMGIYLTDRPVIEEVYNQYIPPFVPVPTQERRVIIRRNTPTETKVGTTRARKTGKTRVRTGNKSTALKLLESIAPNIFISGYARQCQSKLQPIVVTPQEAEEWRNKLVKNTSSYQLEPRQVMPFPPISPPSPEQIDQLITEKGIDDPDIIRILDNGGTQDEVEALIEELGIQDPDIIYTLRKKVNPNYYEEPLLGDRILIVCPGETAPYPGVKVNRLSNNNIYPYIPCCYKEDQTGPRRKSKFNAYYNNIMDEGNSRTRLITDKILYPGGIGEIPITLEQALMRYTDQTGTFKRYGIITGTNSFLHCVLDALDYQGYSGLSNEGKVALASEVRQALTRDIEMAVMKQELYDVSFEDIRNQVATEELFFDPALYYRSVEEYFNVNIYSFTPGKRPKDRNEAIGKIDVPRHKLFHSRPIRPDRVTILIFKHWGAEVDNLNYPHCELLIFTDPNNTKENIKIFPETMTYVAHDILLETFPITTWSYQNQELPTLLARTNLYSLVNFDAFLQQQANSQIQDDYGKMRGLVISNGEVEMAVFFLPSQPENLPIAEKIPLTEAEVAVAWFGEPNAIVLSQDRNQVIGLWFGHPEIPNYPHVIFVPIIPTGNYLTLPEGPLSPLELGESNRQTGARILLLHRQISFLLQILRYLLILAVRNNPNTTIADFMNAYTNIHQEPVVDSASFYDLTQIAHRLPDANTVENAIMLLAPTAPTLFREGRLVLYSRNFADKIQGYLETLLVQVRGINPKLPRYLENYYLYESDFRPWAGTIILIGQDNFNSWRTSLTRAGHQGITILRQLDPSLISRIEPYLYLSTDETISLIQNVETGDLARALHVALSWYLNLINPGFATAPYPDIETLPYRVYEISPSSELRLLEEFTTPESPDALEILAYTRGNYAAILPLAPGEGVRIEEV